MASTSTMLMTMPVIARAKPAFSTSPNLPSRPTTKHAGQCMQGNASKLLINENLMKGVTTAVLAAAMVLPDVAEAAQPGLSPSLKNFVLSIVSGGGVLVAIIGAVIGVSNFDPVKRS